MRPLECPINLLYSTPPGAVVTINGNRTQWSPIRSVIIQVITKLDDRETGVQFVNNEYDYRPTSDETKSHYQLIISITISDCKCPITCKCPINALIGGFIDQSDSRKL